MILQDTHLFNTNLGGEFNFGICTLTFGKDDPILVQLGGSTANYCRYLGGLPNPRSSGLKHLFILMKETLLTFKKIHCEPVFYQNPKCANCLQKPLHLKQVVLEYVEPCYTHRPSSVHLFLPRFWCNVVGLRHFSGPTSYRRHPTCEWRICFLEKTWVGFTRLDDPGRLGSMGYCTYL